MILCRFRLPATPLRAPARRARGQALIEFSIGAGLILTMFYAVFSFWTYFAKQGTYQTIAQSIAQQMAYSPNGRFTGDISTSIHDQLNEAIAVGANDVNLFIIALDPAGNLITQCGTPMAAPLPENPIIPEADDGWTRCASTFSSLTLARGSRVLVDVWSYARLEVPLIGFGVWLGPVGHSVSSTVGGPP